MSGTDCVTEAESAGSNTLIQELVREAEDASSPLSSSPSAKMIKIEEIADVSSHSSEQLVASPPLFQDADFCLWVLITGKVLTAPPSKHIFCSCFPEFLRKKLHIIFLLLLCQLALPQLGQSCLLHLPTASSWRHSSVRSETSPTWCINI